MDSRRDRTIIAPMLLPYYPFMEKCTSDEWHGFLNAMTGLAIKADETNANAFDEWRKALKAQYGLPVWGITPEREAKIKEDGERLKAHTEKQEEGLPVLLASLSSEAPRKTLADLLKKSFSV
jgi:hypothetical protein